VPPWKRTLVPVPFCASLAAFLVDDELATSEEAIGDRTDVDPAPAPAPSQPRLSAAAAARTPSRPLGATRARPPSVARSRRAWRIRSAIGEERTERVDERVGVVGSDRTRRPPTRGAAGSRSPGRSTPGRVGRRPGSSTSSTARSRRRGRCGAGRRARHRSRAPHRADRPAGTRRTGRWAVPAARSSVAAGGAVAVDDERHVGHRRAASITQIERLREADVAGVEHDRLVPDPELGPVRSSAPPAGSVGVDEVRDHVHRVAVPNGGHLGADVGGRSSLSTVTAAARWYDQRSSHDAPR
jgi:hypothetical protein